MKSKRLLVVRVIALALPLACSGSSPSHPGGTSGATGTGGRGGTSGSGGMAGVSGDGRLFVPDDVPNLPRPGEMGVTLKLVASTLVQGTAGPELYAAVRNEGTAPSCNPGIVIDFLDKAGETVATATGALLARQLYRLDATTVLGCIDPGQMAMFASTSLPANLVIGDLGSMQHSFPTFGGFDDLVPVAGYTISQVETFAKSGGSAYRGKLTNGMAMMVSSPSVAIFPVNRVGRPLGAATSSATTDLPPGGTWSFETSAVTDLGVDYVAYPDALIAN